MNFHDWWFQPNRETDRGMGPFDVLAFIVLAVLVYWLLKGTGTI